MSVRLENETQKQAQQKFAYRASHSEFPSSRLMPQNIETQKQ